MSETADPFREQRSCPLHRVMWLLGAEVEFRSNDARLIRLAEESFSNLPRHRWSGARRRLRLELWATPASRPYRRPRAPRFHAGAGCLQATVDDRNFALVNAGLGEAHVQVSADRFAYPYELRYELIEFAAITLCVRALGLIPLHAACVVRSGRGVLLLGDSGAGKSTLTLACASAGLQVLGEDSVFVHPEDGRATGIASFVHLRRSALRLVSDPELRKRVLASPVIRRRGGAYKFRWDLRSWPGVLAAVPVELAGVIVLSPRRSHRSAGLRPLSREITLRELRRSQPYSVRHEHWHDFERQILALGGHRLMRCDRPEQAALALRNWLDANS